MSYNAGKYVIRDPRDEVENRCLNFGHGKLKKAMESHRILKSLKSTNQIDNTKDNTKSMFEAISCFSCLTCTLITNVSRTKIVFTGTQRNLLVSSVDFPDAYVCELRHWCSFLPDRGQKKTDFKNSQKNTGFDQKQNFFAPFCSES